MKHILAMSIEPSISLFCVEEHHLFYVYN